MARASKSIELIAELRESRGWSIARIANHLGCSIGAVSWQCLVNGIEKPGPQKFAAAARSGAIYDRNGHQVRRYTLEEDQRLFALDAEGLSHSEIGRQLGRRPNSVRGRLATLARQEERACADSAR